VVAENTSVKRIDIIRFIMSSSGRTRSVTDAYPARVQAMLARNNSAGEGIGIKTFVLRDNPYAQSATMGFANDERQNDGFGL
jgi:hypothetical protein